MVNTAAFVLEPLSMVEDYRRAVQPYATVYLTSYRWFEFQEKQVGRLSVFKKQVDNFKPIQLKLFWFGIFKQQKPWTFQAFDKVRISFRIKKYAYYKVRVGGF